MTGQPRIEREPDLMMYVGDKVVEFAAAVAGDPGRADHLSGRQGSAARVLVHALPLRGPSSSAWDEAAARAGRAAAEGGEAAEDRRPGRARLISRTDVRDPQRAAAGARSAAGVRVHAGMVRPAVGDDPVRLARPLDDVLEAEARAADAPSRGRGSELGRRRCRRPRPGARTPRSWSRPRPSPRASSPPGNCPRYAMRAISNHTR